MEYACWAVKHTAAKGRKKKHLCVIQVVPCDSHCTHVLHGACYLPFAVKFPTKREHLKKVDADLLPNPEVYKSGLSEI